jgi:hypothetical protein
MSKHFNIFKAELTEDEERYINDRNDLLQARNEAAAHGRLEEAFEEAEESDEDPEGIPVEEWVEHPTTTKNDIIGELKGLGVEHDPKSSKPELAKLLVSTVAAQR